MSKPKILEQIENAGGVFVATKGTTTRIEIKNAYDSGKDIICPYNGDIYELITIPRDNFNIYFHKRDFSNNTSATTKYSEITLNKDGSWEGPTTVVAPDAATFITSSNTITIPISSTTRYYRPILVSTAEPTASKGNVGDIWIQYEA